MNEIVTVAGIAVAAAGAAVLLKQYKPEYAFGISVAAGKPQSISTRQSAAAQTKNFFILSPKSLLSHS